MSFKINDLDRFITEAYEEDEFEPTTTSSEDEFIKFADRAEEDVEGEEGAIPVEASEVESEFEMDQIADGEYVITSNNNIICNLTLSCNGSPADMATLIDPTECQAVITNVQDEEKAEAYKSKLIEMGYKVE